jgi:hypothetical protein
LGPVLPRFVELGRVGFCFGILRSMRPWVYHSNMARTDIYLYVQEDPCYAPEWHWITDDIALGSYPLDGALRDILASGVSAIMSLRVDEPDYDVDLFDRAHVCCVEDREPFPYAKLVGAIRFLHKAIRDGHKVYVHCFAGMSRSPFVVACYLMLERGIPFEEAVAFLKNIREIVAPSRTLWQDGVLDRLLADREAIFA